jgi:hypothetical protein
MQIAGDGVMSGGIFKMPGKILFPTIEFIDILFRKGGQIFDRWGWLIILSYLSRYDRQTMPIN